MIFVVPLSNCSSEDINRIGGKGLTLGRLCNFGISVPRGFIIASEVTDILKKSDKTSWEDVIEQVLDSYDQLKVDTVAVRSSVSVEDGLTKSFAGQFNSYLGVSRNNLMTRVRACMGSLNNARAQKYGQGVLPDNMAVIVQKMINPFVSGVAFTVHPVTGDRGTIVIEAVRGSNQLLVEGLVTPDHYQVSSDYEIKDKQIVVQEIQHSLNGVSMKSFPAHIEEQKMPDGDILRIARMAKHIAKLLKHEVDIEWAIANNTLYVLQSRPITTTV